ncbi:MAG: sigma-70 family RNA polymerase sigma factor [Thermoguttaceae bacterium]|nr:sigma-70 family RNA polymerase sigma factor [Thermoguttaceae bacterium]MDW8078230.1 sigma-70 family RNA polymerase sigma factor [Thermoguttaceae bacterium]
MTGTWVVGESTARRYALGDPDVRLMLEVREGKAAAFEELVLRYQDRLLTVLEHLVGSHHQAEDLVQEVFLRVFRARKSYQPGAKFCTWLFRIAHHVALNALRDQQRRREVSLEARRDSGEGEASATQLEQVVQASSGAIPTRQLDRAELREVVRAALSQLNERQRMAVLLNKFEGMSYAEIGEVMGLSPAAVKALLSRARAALRRVLEPYLETGESPESIPPTGSATDLSTDLPSAGGRPGDTSDSAVSGGISDKL